MTDRFEEIYDAYSGLILAYAARRTGDVNVAMDVVAETYAVAWRRMDDVPAGEQARPWLYGVARRVLANQRRGVERQRRVRQRLQAEFSPVQDDVRRVDEELELRSVTEALARLSDADRELLTLVAWDGLSRDDIAEMLGCTLATVRVRLHRARRRLVREMNVKRLPDAGHGSTRTALPEEV